MSTPQPMRASGGPDGSRINSVRITRESEKGSKEAPKITSRYFLTINSQQTLETLGDEGKAQFEKRCAVLLKSFSKLVKVKPGYPENLDEAEMDISHEFEVGNKTHRYHMHSTIEIKHNTHITVDFESLDATAKQYGYYANVRFAGNDQTLAAMLNYIRKTL